MSRRFYIAGFSFGLLGVILGAFAAHGLKPVLSEAAFESFETGTKFQIYHALLLLIIGNIIKEKSRIWNWIFFLLIAGISLFSGSIYLLATNSITAFDFSVIAVVTPLGGGLLIFCWGLLLFHFLKLKKK